MQFNRMAQKKATNEDLVNYLLLPSVPALAKLSVARDKKVIKSMESAKAL